MYARIASACLALGMFASLGANYRTQHFIISAPTSELAKEVGDAAEAYRRDLAIEWLGRELPRWQDPCPIEAQIAPHLGAGGETSFMFQQRTPFSWRMRVQGTRERVLDSVLPHEITHTIFATHFGRPLPRWADEGACTTVEHDSEKGKQDKLLIQFLSTNRGIPFNQMFAMKDYPPDILPLYSQGFSLAKFLIAQGGKLKYTQYVGEGMDRNNWTVSTKRHYGYDSLGDLQVTWLEWVKRGAPSPLPNDLVRNQPLEQPGSPVQLVSSQGDMLPPQQAAANAPPVSPGMQELMQGKAPIRGGAGPNGYFAANTAVKSTPTPAAPSNFAADSQSTARTTSEGWYQRQRDAARSGFAETPPTNPQPGPNSVFPEPPVPGRSVMTSTTNQNPPVPETGPRQVLLEWSRDSQQPAGRDQQNDWSRLPPNPIRR